MTHESEDQRPDTAPVVGAVWVHAFEEDEGGDAVYRPEGDPFPLSRRPRRRIALHADGTATVADGGADDRPAGHGATWTEAGGMPVIRCADGSCLQVVERRPRRLLVRVERAGGGAG